LNVSYVTTGQNVPRDIEEAGGRRVAELLGLAGAE
jgi:flagellar biosynthesis GTPase FlhF